MKCYIRTILCAAFTLLPFGPLAAAEDTQEYSVEAYCVLANGKVSEQYLKVYESKLGSKPSSKVCNSFKEASASLETPKWNYAGNRPYPGSVIRLSNEQVELLKQAQKEALSH